MQIAICDDEEFFRKELKEYLIDFRKENRLYIDIFEFSNGEAFFECDRVFDIVFLDYQMPMLNGMDIARRLRNKNALCKIVFITNYPDFVFESFEVAPYRFFKKPILKSEINSMLIMYIQQQKKLAPIIINDYYGQKTIPSKDIIYVEGDGKYCVIRTITETIHSSKTVAKVMELLPKYCFFRTHKSYLVNMYCIDRVDNNIIILINGEKIVISRNNIPSFKKAYLEFVKNFYLRA